MELQQNNLMDDLTKPQVFLSQINTLKAVSYTHLRAHET